MKVKEFVLPITILNHFCINSFMHSFIYSFIHLFILILSTIHFCEAYILAKYFIFFRLDAAKGGGGTELSLYSLCTRNRKHSINAFNKQWNRMRMRNRNRSQNHRDCHRWYKLLTECDALLAESTAYTTLPALDWPAKPTQGDACTPL